MSSLDAPTQELIAAARAARRNSYSPYSHFAVGASVRTADGALHAGCNVENASFGLTLCAERNAIVTAVGQGARRITAVAIATDGDGPRAWPCGACRQVLAEFGPDMEVFVVGDGDAVWAGRLGELLPHQFDFPFSGEGS
ncbi:MAG: cytidine deaminase [Planctomycetota bacterium]